MHYHISSEFEESAELKRFRAAAFGCYGWSGEAVKLMSEGLAKAGFAVVADGLSTPWEPGSDELARACAFGESFPALLK